MRRSRLLITLSIVLVLAAIGIGAALIFGADADESTIELAGTKLSDEEARDMTNTMMGTPKLENIRETGPDDADESANGTLVGNVRTFTLEAEPVRWEYRDGQRVAAWAYNGQVPGPTLRANEGETIRVEFRNSLPMPTTVHWHGVDVPWKQDGVPGVSQPPVEPGKTYSYEFKATPAGTRWYHTHGSEMGDEATQIDMGLSGALVISPKAPARELPDVDRVLVLDEWSIGASGYNSAMLAGHGAHTGGASFNVFTINGRAAPDIEDIVVKKGDRVRLRFVNASSVSYHPMHVHGHQARVVALDGNPVPSPTVRNVELLAPGQTADVEFIANNPGVWMMHCHDLHHSSSGMTMLLRYEGYEPVGDEMKHDEEEDGEGKGSSDSKPDAEH